MITADHGPAVSGAHNTIVAARAGKDLISSTVSGMLTIGPRFGGALDGAAQQFSNALRYWIDTQTIRRRDESSRAFSSKESDTESNQSITQTCESQS